MSEQLYVIAGLGTSGFSALRYLKARGEKVAVTDSRSNPPCLEQLQKTYPDVPCVLGKLDMALLEQATSIVLSPGISLQEPVIAAQVKRGKPVLGDIELFAQAVKASVIAITGTNAKSTVTTLVGEMAKTSGYQVGVGGNLGIPALDLLMQIPSASLYVLELSSFQLETTYSLAPAVASILNITPDHMDRYRDLADYQAAKLRIYQHCEIAVCNRDDNLTECAQKREQEKFYFTMGIPGPREFGLLTEKGKSYLAYEKKPLLAVDEIPVIGKHYQANALAALAMGFAFGMPMESMLQVLRTFPGLPHRCQFVREREGVKWYNDSKGTNVGATQAAIEGLGSEMNGKLVLIAGGVGKSADFSPLVPAIQKYSRQVVLIGEAAQDLANVIGNRVKISFAQSMEEAVNQAATAAKPKDSVLLSPACASFDMFNNFEHRGQVFMEVVNKL